MSVGFIADGIVIVAGIQHFRDTVMQEKCQRYIRHLKKVLPAVIARED